jgi:two-component system, LytTR family, sensor histidine kinase AlgZ
VNQQVTPARRLLLPDFCTPRAVLLILTIVTLTALLLTLAGTGFDQHFWSDLAGRLLFLVWIGLPGAGLLCALRQQIAIRSVAFGTLLVLALVTALVALVSEIAFLLMTSSSLGTFGLLAYSPGEHWTFLARNLAIGLIVCGLALRYSYVTQQWRSNVEGEARARVDALQARIRPHFLYNSMNTIAALTRTDPARAEDAVLDLADLFRASLKEQHGLITLAEELDAARIYQRIEKLRLGDRLQVQWNVDALPPRALVPALTLQPLLENAVRHGIENLAAGGTVTVEGSATDGVLLLTVRNPMPLDNPQRGDGHGLALPNIRERFALLFGARASVTAQREGDGFVVQLRWPATETKPGAAS